ncbi:MAG TPA: ATP-binding protein [Herpetosiphonaceae bacterium]|nr:ATP-binding protein [Herpetosiphonaceae bacterium]
MAAFLIASLTTVTFWLYANNLQEQLNQSLRTSATNTGLGLETLEARLLDNLRPVVTSQANPTENISSTVDAFSNRDVNQIQRIVDLAFGYYRPARILAFDANGTVVVDTAKPEVRENSPSVVGTNDLSSVPLVKAVLNGEIDQYGDKYASLLRFGTDPPYTMFFVIAPVKAKTGGGAERVVGALMYAEPLDSVVQNDLTLRNNAPITAILDGNGAVLAGNPPNQSNDDLKLSQEQIAQIKTAQQTPGTTTGSTLLTTVQRGDLNFQVIYSPLRIRRVLDGYFAVGLPRSTFDKAWQQTQVAMGIAVVLGLGFVVFIGSRVTRSITTPLNELVDTAIQVSAGDLERRSNVTSNNELGTLSSVLNDMTDRLLDLYRTSRELGGELAVGGVLQQANAAINRLAPTSTLGALIVNDGDWKYYTPTTERETREIFSATALYALPPVVDLAEDASVKYALAEIDPQARLLLPLRTGQQTLGTLVVSDTAEINTAALSEPLTAIASMTATAVQNALLYSTVQEEASRKQAILQSIADGVVVFDADNRIMLTNSTAATMLGFPAEDLIGHTFEELDVKPIQGNAELFGTSGGAPVFYQSNRSERILSMSAAPVEGLDGRRSGEVLVLHDVTAEREMDRAKTDFIATISHELRTPLTSICGYADLLLRGFAGDLSDEQRDFMQTIRQQGQTMVDVLQNVIIIASIESGSMQPIAQPYPVASLVDQAVSATRKAIETKKLELVVDVPLDLPEVLIDRDHMQIVLVQLLDNARRYTSSGSITIRAHKSDDGVQLDIQDTGQGIPVTDQGRMFKRFQRGGEQSGLTSKERGVGLGLAIARQLIENSGGRIWFTSTVGEGSTFSIMLPIAAEEKMQSNEYGIAAAA